MSHASYLLLILALTGWAMADVPKKAPITRYTGLWTNSPFTSKPPPEQAPEAVNPLSDYALGGISPIQGGYRVTLLNRKKTDERLIIESDDASSGFKILTVNRKPGDPLGTTVRLSSGSNIGVVAFDEKLLALKTAAPDAKKPQQPQNPPGVGQQPNPPGSQGQPNSPGQPNQNIRQPRPRVIPAPTSGQQNNSQQQNQRRPLR